MSVASTHLVVHIVSDSPQACAEHRLDSVNIKTKPGFAVSVVLASQGYPGSYPKGKQITIGSVPSSESAGPLHHNRLMGSLQMLSSSMLERPCPTIKSSHLVGECSQSRRMPKPFRLHWTQRIPQLITFKWMAKRTAEISPIGCPGVNRCGSTLLTCHTQSSSTCFRRNNGSDLRKRGGVYRCRELSRAADQALRSPDTTDGVERRDRRFRWCFRSESDRIPRPCLGQRNRWRRDKVTCGR